MPEFTGGCTCGQLRYKLTLESVDDARTSLCHCWSCKRAMGGAFGLTAKVPLSTYQLTNGSPKIFIQDNGVRREFCTNCGAFVCEYGEANVDKFRYVMAGTLDDGPDALPPKGEFFTRYRNKWMPEIPGTFQREQLSRSER